MQSVSRTPEQKHASLVTARILLEIGAVNFRPSAPYTLTSGWSSPVYIDLVRLISFPRARRKITELSAAAITRDVGYESIDAVAGGETEGIPYAAWISEALSLPMLYVRKQPKRVGRNAQIEGHFVEGDRVLLVGDLASDGASKVSFCEALRKGGAAVDHAFVVFYYGVFPGSFKTLEAMGIQMHFLANWWDILEVTEDGRYFDKPALEEVRKFLHDPLGWSAHHGGRSA
jgi:orotate phosphoribosyltransferase